MGQKKEYFDYKRETVKKQKQEELKRLKQKYKDKELEIEQRLKELEEEK